MIDVYRWCDDLRKKSNYADISKVIESRLRETSDAQERDVLIANLVHELSTHHKDNEAEGWLLQSVKELPGDPRPWIRLANHYLYFQNDVQKLYDAVEAGLAVARCQRKFVRELLGVKARAGLQNEQFNILRQAVSEIVEVGYSPDEIDIPLERDFIDRAPPGTLSDELLSRFERLYEEARRCL